MSNRTASDVSSPYAISVRRAVRMILPALAVLSLCTGCVSPSNDSSAMRISSVDPLTEPEFDAFAARIADRLTPLANTSTGQPAKLGAPQLVVEDEAWRPSARYFSYALMDGLSDRTGGTLNFSRAADDPVQYRTMLMFSTSKKQSDRRTVEFVVTDASGSREVLRESAESTTRARPPEVAAAQPAPAQPPPKPPVESHPPRKTSEREVASATRPPPAAARERQSRQSPPPRRDAPPIAAEGEPVAEASIEPPGEARAAETPAAVARPIEPRESKKPLKPKEIKIDANSSEIGRQVEISAPLYARRTLNGAGGSVILLDEDTVESFAVAGQHASRNNRGQFQTQLTLVCGRDSRDADYRVVFYDDAGEPVSATPVLSLEFERHERKRITVTAGDSRAARYVWLVQED